MSGCDPAIVVVGSLHLDLMVGAPDRPKKGETLVGSRWWMKTGGKGCNQVLAARRHGASVAMVGCIGRDDFGNRLLAHLDAAHVDTDQVRRTAEAGSGMSVAIVDDAGDYGAIIVSGSNLLLAPDDVQRAAPMLAACKLLLLQHEVNDDANCGAAQLARDGGARVLLNAAPAKNLAPGLVGMIDILVINAIEAEAMGAAPVVDLQSALAAARGLNSMAPTVVVTVGGQGVAAVAEGDDHALPAEPVQVVGTHGAGDVFVGALAARLADDADFGDALAYANRVAARHVGLPEDSQTRLLRDDDA